MINRLIFGFLFFFIAVAAIYLDGYYFIVFFLFLSIRSQWEILRAFKNKGFKPYFAPNLIFSALIFPANHYFGMEGIVILFLICGSMILLGSIRKSPSEYADVLVSISSLFYPTFLWVCFLRLYVIEDNGLRFLSLALVVIIPILTDVFALVFGIKFGKHKFAPKISPKKSIEGAIAGLFGGIAAGALIYFISIQFITLNIPFVHFIIMGLLGSIFAQMGDWTASAIKRYTGVKDYGRLIPGHGGLMDRLDSVLMSSLPLYIYITLLIL